MQKRIAVFYTASARKDLKKLDKQRASKIVLTIAKYTKTNPLLKAKVLSGVFRGLYRYRVGDYRVIFEYDETGNLYILTVLRIKHRKDIYKK